MMSVIGPGVAKYALKFGPPEYVGLLVLSLTAIISFSGVSLTKGLGVGLIGLILATVGIDSTTGAMRFCFGSLALTRGFDLIPVVVGLFGIGEILESTEEGRKKIFEGKLGKMMPRGEELKKGLWASLRGTMVGFWPGVLPGMVPTLTTFLAYDLEKKYSKYPERFGTGVIEGVAAPEAANNATVQAGFIPLFALGIPTGPANAMILASLMLYGLVPGPTMFRENSVFVWTVIASMYMGNVMLVVLNLPLVGLWARVSLLPYKFLAPAVLGICLIGAYSPRNAMFDLWVAIGAGILGYFMKKMNWPTMPLILGLILGSMFEQALRQSFAMGGPMIFLKRPVAVCLILLAIIIMLISLKYLKRIPKAVLLEGNTDS
jgi:putative tricarboxylic transport membrane protein